MLQWMAINTSTKRYIARALCAVAILFVFGFIFSPALAHAQSVADPNSNINQGLNVIQQPLGLPATDIRVIIARVIRAALGLLGIVFLVLVLYAGFLWMTSAGQEDRIEQAKKMLLNAVIGLIIILSAYAIVLFVMRLLGIDQVGGNGNGSLNPPDQQNFQGSGALGSIIKDHYPSRNQTDVARNTKIIITFRRPVNMNTIVQDTNGSGTYGDCVKPGNGQPLNWLTNCDQMIEDSSHILVTRTDTGTPINGAAVLASADENGFVYTITIRPIDTLGDEQTKAPYVVHIGNSITIADQANGNPSLFKDLPPSSNYYEWQFTCSTELDLTPPFVSSVFPSANSTEAKNSIIQIDFSEAMDPYGLQGALATNSDYFKLLSNFIFIKTQNTALPKGTFTLVNGYKTLEFTPTTVCGQNACGGKIYCLPVCDKPGANCTLDNYEVLLKTADTFSSSSFQSVPLSGVADVAGNALDGDNRITNGKRSYAHVDSNLPVFGDPKKFDSQEQPDNYFWNFSVDDHIDASAPYLESVYPGLDAQNVGPDEDWTMTFTKRMRADSMYSINIGQDPPQNIPLCHMPRVSFFATSTLTSMQHCPFLQGSRTYYFPIVNSDVEDVHFNCFYPGRGPNSQIQNGSLLKQSAMCEADGTNCCAVTSSPQAQAFCCNGLTGISSTAQCINALRGNP